MRYVLLLLACYALGSKADLVVDQAWARATPPGAPMGAVYLELVNGAARSVSITAVRTPAAAVAEVHESYIEDGMARMREVMPLVIEPGAQLSLAPGGLHIMLMKLNEPLKPGDSFPLVLVTADGEKASATVEIGSYAQMSAPQGSK